METDHEVINCEARIPNTLVYNHFSIQKFNGCSKCLLEATYIKKIDFSRNSKDFLKVLLQQLIKVGKVIHYTLRRLTY